VCGTDALVVAAVSFEKQDTMYNDIHWVVPRIDDVCIAAQMSLIYTNQTRSVCCWLMWVLVTLS
jgi:hypothetical protein